MTIAERALSNALLKAHNALGRARTAYARSSGSKRPAAFQRLQAARRAYSDVCSQLSRRFEA